MLNALNICFAWILWQFGLFHFPNEFAWQQQISAANSRYETEQLPLVSIWKRFLCNEMISCMWLNGLCKQSHGKIVRLPHYELQSFQKISVEHDGNLVAHIHHSDAFMAGWWNKTWIQINWKHRNVRYSLDESLFFGAFFVVAVADWNCIVWYSTHFVATTNGIERKKEPREREIPA